VRVAEDSRVPFFDVADPAFSVSSAEVHRARENGWYARTRYGLAVLRYDQAARLIRHPDVRQGSVAWPAHHGITSGPFAQWWSGWVLNKEGEDHQRLRRLLTPAFSRRFIDALVPRLAELAGELAGSFAATGRCEFMAEFAAPYAARVIAIILGLPEQEWPTIAAESAAVGLAMGVRIREDLPRIEAALANLYAYADALITDRGSRPRDDFVTALVQAQADGERLTAAELRDSLVLLIFGGFDTTRNQLGLAMQAFIDHPSQWRLLGENPGLGPAAVEEVMRISPTTTWVTREAVSDFTFDGLSIEAGTTIHLFCESAGTDSRAFGDAEFDITATGRPPHFGFGGGVHYCLGHLVARTDMSVALPLLARTLREPRVCGEAVWLPCSGNTGPARLPIAFDPA
jgi:cytochrome P450